MSEGFSMSRCKCEASGFCPECAKEKLPISILGDFMDCSIADHNLACFALIEEEQRKILPDTRLIAVLCDSVRLGREFARHARQRLDGKP